MDAIKDYVTKNPYVALAIALAVGVGLGLFFAWWVWPVEWADASPADLTGSFQTEYVQLVADSYALNQNAELARTRMAALGDNNATALQAALTSAQGADNLRISNMAAAIGAPTAGGQTPGEEAAPSLLSSILGVLPYVCGAIVVLALLAGGAFYFMSRQGQAGGTRAPTLRTRTEPTASEMATVAPPTRAEGGAEPAIAQFMTTYVAGDDLYDDSFSVDSPSGDFLGECGVGISETIGVGDPKKVAALEVWLFDKNDIRTVTKVLMSEHTFNDDATRSKLAAKGEPALAKAGDTLTLETATLRVTARVVDLAYGGGPLPPNSYFDRITIELAAWQKESEPVI